MVLVVDSCLLCLFLIRCCSLFAARCVLCVVCRMLCVVRWCSSLFVVLVRWCSSLFVVCGSLCSFVVSGLLFDLQLSSLYVIHCVLLVA